MAFNQPLTKNGEGYNSPTEFEALRRVLRGNGLRNGEIWETENKQGVVKQVVVLAEHSKQSQILTLTDEMYQGNVPVKGKYGMMYTSPEMLSYTFNEYFTRFIRVLDDDEFIDLLDACAICLGISAGVIEKEVPVEKIVEVEKVVEVPSGNIEELAKLRAEASIYKQMYEELLQKMIK